MGDFLVELDGCLYDNPEDVVEEFNKLRAERDALKAENNLLQAAQGMLKAERDALKSKLELAENYISVLEMAADGYYRVEKSEEAKVWYAAQEDEQQ